MKRASAYLPVLLLVGLLGSGFRTSPPAVAPGGRIGSMTLVRGTSVNADANIFDFCNPFILKAGRYHRTCHIGRVHRLFIGYGDFERTKKALDAAWRRLHWQAWVDGRPVRLAPFGTIDLPLNAPPGTSGKAAILREWRVVLAGVTPGRHTVRYRSTSGSAGTIDCTWTVVVAT